MANIDYNALKNSLLSQLKAKAKEILTAEELAQVTFGFKDGAPNLSGPPDILKRILSEFKTEKGPTDDPPIEEDGDADDTSPKK